MIPNQWYAVLSAREVRPGKPVGVTRLGQKLVFWRRQDGTVGCLADQCCHRGAALSCGKVAGDEVVCPFHGFAYDESGRVTRIPANGRARPVPPNFRVQSYPAREAHGFVWVWYGAPRDLLPAVPFFEELENGFAYGEFSEVWGVHYTRAIENQLDVVHLPFVHSTTIGRGNKVLVNGPVVKWNEAGDRMTFYVKNTADEGQRPQTPDEIADYAALFHLQLQMPNLWQNVISDKVRIVAAFAPVDEEHTRIYLRFYHAFATAPVARELAHFMGNRVNAVVLHQDRRVVATQLPKKSELRMGENLVQGDLPIVAYRKKRQELKDAAARG